MLTQQQVVDTFARLRPAHELALPLDPVQCLWLYFTQEELEQQLANLTSLDMAAFKTLDALVRDRRDSLIASQ
jgi:hypothetical protein